MGAFLSTREVGELLSQPEHRIRKVCDSIPGVQRFSGRRAIPRDLLPTIIDALRNRGWLQEPQGVAT